MKDPIARRIFDYAKKLPPFDLMVFENLLELCEAAAVKHLGVNQIDGKIGKAKSDEFEGIIRVGFSMLKRWF